LDEKKIRFEKNRKKLGNKESCLQSHFGTVSSTWLHLPMTVFSWKKIFFVFVVVGPFGDFDIFISGKELVALAEILTAS
jgi:hypothetical protein